uniref:Multiple epidermal growth factor-like domains protein 10 n=1 Tax=Ciona intestinalis TaxID=7719 RepID=H2XUC8_CIOIN|nr:multiple epidermal growth factor-like domains protein 10 [Ciona intestinalis]|eukprot:XP_002128961.1 multiple epidermal growth factor-like domains protein 10 [Ciona intestinalis]
MNSFIGITLVLFIGVVASQNCTDDHWGEDCMNACGNCYVLDSNQPKCDPITGKCANGCTGGYTGVNCEKANCVQDCGPGLCVAENYCANCGDISLVSPNCEDIRLRGLLGSLMAFGVIAVSVTLCGFGSIWWKRRMDPSVTL